MSETSKAVFLSYASQDAEPARRICEALRGAGVEVWFDADGGLEHGDEWDAKIRRQIKECVLFIPVISAHTQAREEGYFRIEWELAAQRAMGIASGVPFILPVVIDDTREPDALVPDRFRVVQWTRLRAGEVPPEVLQRFLKLWSHRVGVLKKADGSAAARKESVEPRPFDDIARPPKRSSRAVLAGAGLLVLLAVTAWWLLAGRHRVAPPGTIESPPPQTTAAAPVTEARRLTEQARTLLLKPGGGLGNFETAALLCDQALTVAPTDAEAWAISSQADTMIASNAFDTSEKRIAGAQTKAIRAITLAPRSFEARHAQASFQAFLGGQPVAAAAEATLRTLHAENPREVRVLYALIKLLRSQGRGEEALTFADEAARLPDGAVLGLTQKAWVARGLWRFDEADAALDQSIALEPVAGAVGLKVFLDLCWRGDAERALASLKKLPADELTMDVGMAAAVRLYRWRREPAEVLRFLAAVPRDWLPWGINGPKAALTGDANAELNRPQAAQADWRTALTLVEQRLTATPNDRDLLEWKAYLEASLGDKPQAQATWQRSREVPAPSMPPLYGVEKISRVLPADPVIDELERRVKNASDQLSQHRQSSIEFISAAALRLDPAWDGLRGLPRFQALQAQLDADPRFCPAAKSGPRPTDVSAAPAKSHPQPAPADKSVAVLAFNDLSEKHDSEYFSDGISEELLNVLAKVPGLKVTARTSAFFFKGKNLPIPEIARQLGVAYVVEGSVQRAGDNVRITAQLIKAADGFHVWSEHFDRELKNIFALQDEIAGLIAKQLSLRLSAASGAANATVNPQALEFYLQASQLMRLRDTIFMNTRRVEELLNQALVLDPKFSPARAMLAAVWVARGGVQTSGINRFGQRHAPETERIAAKVRDAIALDPTAPDAHLALALGMWIWWDRAGAESELRTVLSLNPNNAAAHRQLGFMSMDDGRMDDAIAEVNLAVQLDPLAQDVLESRARVLHVAGRYTDAIASYDRALALADSAVAREHKAYALAQLGQKDAALALARNLPTPSLRFRTLAAAGARAEAEAVFPATEPENRAYYLLMLGRTEEALAALDPAEIQSTYLHDILFEPWFDPVRNDPRFKKVLATLGVTEAHARAQAWRAAHPAENGEVRK